MWISVVLICDNPSYQPSIQSIHHWFNDFVLSLDSSLQAEISRDNTERVFTTSPFYLSHRGYPAWLRITSVDSRLNQVLQEHLPKLRNDYLQLGEEKIRVSEVYLPKTSPPFLQNVDYMDRFNPLAWVGYTHPIQLISAIMQTPLNHKLRLNFHTPTRLRDHSPMTYKDNLLPLPHQVFGTYARKWQTFTASAPIIPLMDFLNDYTRLNQYHLRTYDVSGWKWGRVTGFTGYVDYGFIGVRHLPSELARDREHLIRTCYLLAAFAFFVGTGQLTSFGMGQTLPNLFRN